MRDWKERFNKRFPSYEDIWEHDKVKDFIEQILSERDKEIIKEERFRIWIGLCDIAEPDERQFGAGELNTHLDVVHKIINVK